MQQRSSARTNQRSHYAPQVLATSVLEVCFLMNVRRRPLCHKRQGTATSFTPLYTYNSPPLHQTHDRDHSPVLQHTTLTANLESVHSALNSSPSSFALHHFHKQSSSGAFKQALLMIQLARLHINPDKTPAIASHMHCALYSLDHRNTAFCIMHRHKSVPDHHS